MANGQTEGNAKKTHLIGQWYFDSSLDEANGQPKEMTHQKTAWYQYVEVWLCMSGI